MIERDSVTAYLPVLAAFARRRRHRVAQELRQARRARLSSESTSAQAFSSASTFWPNCVPRLGELFVDRGEPLLLGLWQLGAGLDEALPVAFQHARLLRASGRGSRVSPRACRCGRKALHSCRSSNSGATCSARSPAPEPGSYHWYAAPALFQNSDETRDSASPAISSATTVLSNVGASPFPAISSISAFMRGKRCVEGRGEIAVAHGIETRQAVKTVPGHQRRIEIMWRRHRRIPFWHASGSSI